MTRLRKFALLVAVGLPLLATGGLWAAGNQLLYPSWKGATKDFTVCGAELAAAWGDGCGNLRLNGALRFSEVTVPSLNGYDMPGWLMRAADNGRPPAPGAIMLIHGGGSDRREVTRHAPFFLDRGLDVLTLDLGCHGEAPCPIAGLSYGERESQDVVAAYLYLAERYSRVVAMGSSAGAASLLIALPSMPQLAGVIAENPMASFDRLIRETPASQSIPAWFTERLIESVKWRGRFTALLAPEHALALVKSVPILFIHSRQDEIVPYRQSQELAGRYRGPKTTWWPEHGAHSAIWEADRAAYEARLTTFLSALTEKETGHHERITGMSY